MNESENSPLSIMDKRKSSDILLLLEEKVNTLVKVVANYDLTNKLLLVKINQLLDQKNITSPSSMQPMAKPSIIQVSGQPAIELSNEPIKSKRMVPAPKPEPSPPKMQSSPTKEDKQITKIPVGQRITDNTGKDLIMANVIITSLQTNEEVAKTQTNAVGKWHTYLSVGTYKVAISKIDMATKNKIECLQEIEVSPELKSLQLPTAIIKRNNA